MGENSAPSIDESDDTKGPITEEMVAAGVEAYDRWKESADAYYLVRAIYLAMDGFRPKP